jgi:hypothetical protein
MATYRSRRGQPQPGLLARTVGQLVDHNRELKRRQDELERRIRELEEMRGKSGLTGSSATPRSKK